MEQRTAARLAWSAWAVGALLGGTGLVLTGLNDPIGTLIEGAILYAIFLGMATVGALAASRHPGNATGWIFLAIGFCAGIAFASSEYADYALRTRPGSLPGAVYVGWLSDWIWALLIALPITFLPLLFPDGRLPSRRWRPFAWLCAIFIAFAVTVFILDPGPVGPTGVSNPFGVEALRPVAAFLDGPGYAVLLMLAVVSVASLILRFRQADGAQRQQLKWFVFGVAVLAAYFVLDGILTALGIETGRLVDTVLSAVAFLALPVGAGIGMLRYRLYDIDVVINRTVLFGILAAFITAIYVAIVIGIGSLVGGRGNLFLSIVATAMVAVAFQPVRSRARHFANRLVYGKRATPYEVLSTFSDHLGEAYSTEDILPRMARMMGEATGAEQARVWIRVADELRPAAVWPAEAPLGTPLRSDGDRLPAFPQEERAFPVRHQSELLGALSLTTSRREPLNTTQEKLVSDLAGQAGLILRNVRLIEELRASRQRLVTAQDEERRRLERDIHDGAQQQLVALAVKLRLARTLAGRDAERARSLLDELQGETQEALENLRDLARGIYPPLLADRGLAAALEAQARKVPFPVQVEPNGVGRYPPDAEATVYFCVLEALQNAAKYADASRAVVRLSEEDGRLVFSVSDDGAGFDVERSSSGTGLQNMADRVDAMGGSLDVDSSPGLGTTVTGRIPLSTP
jgi:signal transduction histidine kinase